MAGAYDEPGPDDPQIPTGLLHLDAEERLQAKVQLDAEEKRAGDDD